MYSIVKWLEIIKWYFVIIDEELAVFVYSFLAAKR